MIERIRQALLDAGWCPQLWDRGFTYNTEGGRAVLCVYADNEGRWVAVVAGRPAAYGHDPLTALRRAYAAEDSRRVRDALRPVLVGLRGAEWNRVPRFSVAMERAQEAVAPKGEASREWWDRLMDLCVGVCRMLDEVHLGRDPVDPADATLLALDLAGDPPEEIRNTVAGLRARLEEMG